MPRPDLGEYWRQKLIALLPYVGIKVNRYRPAYIDSNGDSQAESRTSVYVWDLDTLKATFKDVSQFFDVGTANQDNSGLIEMIYAGESTAKGNETSFHKPVIAEGDELHFNGWVHTVNREKPFPIGGVNSFRHITITRERPL